jgi:DNA-binding CsgD family transcriptional regulator
MQELTLPASVAPPVHEGAAAGSMLEQMLDIVDYGMLLLLPNGRVAFANHAARLELQDHPLLSLHGSALHVRHACDAAPLRDALVAALHKGCQKLLTLGDDGRSWLSIAVVPLACGAAVADGVLLLLGKRTVCEELSIDAFGRQHELTLAEQRVLKLLCAGRRPGEVAGTLGVALSTVRTQTGSILVKTGMPGIGALLRELSRLPPLRSVLHVA